MLTDDEMKHAEQLAAENKDFIARYVKDPEARRALAAHNEALIDRVRSDQEEALRLKDEANRVFIAGIVRALDKRKSERSERCSLTLLDYQYLMEIEAAFRKDLTPAPLP
jgi:hypothetical protein